MDDSLKTRRSIFRAHDVSIGEESSRLSSVIFVLLCVVPVFATILFGAVDNTTWIFISLFWAVIIMLWLTDAWKARGLLLNTTALQVPLLGLITVGLVQLTPLSASLDPYSTRFFVSRLVVYLVFFAACLTYVNTELRLKKAVLMVIVFGALMAFFGILQRLASPDGIYGIRETAQSIPFGPFVNQHHFAAFMQMTGGVTVGLLFGNSAGRDKKILLVIALVVMSVATILTGSRGGLLGFLSVLVFVTILNFLPGPLRRASGNNTSKFALIAAAVAIIALTLGVVLFLGGDDSLLRGVGIANAEGDISTGRAHFWPIAIRIFLEHPILGAGYDAFGVAFTKHDTWNGVFRVEQAHNEYLQTLADAGIAGFICVAGFIYLLFRKALATIANAVGGFRQDAAIGALAGCFGILIHSFFDFPLRTPSNAFFFLLIAATATVPISRKP